MSSNDTVAYLGPAGTFTEQAAGELFPGARLVPVPTIRAVVEAVELGRHAHGVVPIENSLEGGVDATLDALAGAGRARIVGEHRIRVRQALAAQPGVGLAAVRQVHSHPQALGQCERALATRVPGAALVPASSTAAALELVSRSRPEEGIAAIGRSATAVALGLAVLVESLEDAAGNETRFVAIGTARPPRTGRDRTTLLVVLEDRPGALARALNVFEALDLNLSRIESRPSRRRLGEYVFFVDVEGHVEDAALGVALSSLGRRAATLQVLGSYPRARDTSGG